MTVARYIYSDISACAIETMTGKWCVLIKIAVGFLKIEHHHSFVEKAKRMTDQCPCFPYSICMEHIQWEAVFCLSQNVQR